MPSIEELHTLQALPLNVKVKKTQQRIREWVNYFGEDGVYVSFSGGKDSTVLLHLVRELYPSIPAVFCDTGLEYPEIREFVKTFDNVEWVKPKMTFREVIGKYGYPFISKEVSEVVYGARKYLTSVLNGIDNLTDRQTDRPYWYRYKRLCGMGEYRNTNTTSSATSLQGEPNMGSTQHTHTHTVGEDILGKSQGLLPLAIILTEDCGVKHQRTRQILGKHPKTKKREDSGDRSMFSCERYQFFLDAPFEICNRCCNVMKKEPMHRYEKQTKRVPMTAQTASESRLRTQVWLRNGCNAFNAKKQISNPMSFWTEQDVLLYIYKNKLPIASVYGDVVKDKEIIGQMDLGDFGLFDDETPLLRTTGATRTGCIFCGFGCHLEKNKTGRFEMLKETHPKQYEYIMKPWEEGGLGYKEVIDWINEHGNLNIKY